MILESSPQQSFLGSKGQQSLVSSGAAACTQFWCFSDKEAFAQGNREQFMSPVSTPRCQVPKNFHCVCSMAPRSHRLLVLAASLVCARSSAVFSCDGGATVLEESRVRAVSIAVSRSEYLRFLRFDTQSKSTTSTQDGRVPSLWYDTGSQLPAVLAS